jgi:tetratricopeptide (TPR) repeat protein
MSRFLRCFSVWLAVAAGLAGDDSPAIRSALAALQRGDFAAAEQVLRPEVNARPNDASALTLLGVALDNEKKLEEAGDIHRRAVASAPNSPDAWNNYANHVLATGDEAGAGRFYLRAVALDPANYNASVQLARLAVKSRNGAQALTYLKHLTASQQDAPNLAPLRIAAVYLAGENLEGDNLAAHWLAAARSDLGLSFSIGLALADAGKFEGADAFFTQALALAPADFNLLFNLGAVLWHTGNYQRAHEVLEAAQRQQPQNVDVLYNLAGVDHAANRNESAVALLAQAARLAPQRSDVQKLLAMTTGDLGALDDSAAAWDRYMQLAPNDDVGRRERGFTAFKRGLVEQALADVQWFVARHPDDPVGHFELGAMQNKDNPAQALVEYDRALALKPDFGVAHSERGSLYYQMGKPEAALPDLEAAVALRPDDAVSLDRLGQTYLAVDRASDAVRVLRRASALSPDDSKMQLHLARALSEDGQAAESKIAMDRFRQLGPAVNHAVPGGLVDYLSLTPEERRVDYRRRVERLVREHPEDAAGQSDYLQLLLDDGDSRQAAEVARTLRELKPSATVLGNAGRALLEAGQYVPARDLLERAAAAEPNAGGVQLDLARAAFHASGSAEGMRLLDGVPDSARSWDFYLARAEMQDAAGNASEAAAALAQALRASPGQADPYVQVCLFLLRKGRISEAAQVSGEALEALSEDREILLLRAVVLQLSGDAEAARSVLDRIQNRWPEWAAAWAAEGIVLGKEGHRNEAIASLRTAAALGANSKELKNYLDQLTTGGEAAPPDLILVLTKSFLSVP